MTCVRDGKASQTTAKDQLILTTTSGCFGASFPEKCDQMEANAQLFQTRREWAHGGMESGWFSVTMGDDAESRSSATGDIRTQPDGSTCDRVETGTSEGRRGHYSERAKICTYNARNGQLVPSCGLAPSEVPCSSSSTLTTTSTLPPSPIREPRVPRSESLSGHACSFELSYGVTREAVNAEIADHAAQRTSCVDELRPSSSPSNREGFAARRQNASGTHIISGSRNVVTDLDDGSQRRSGSRGYTAGNVCSPRSDLANCGFPLLFPTVGDNTGQMQNVDAGAVGRGMPVPLCSRQVYREESAMPQVVAGTWDVTAYGELDLSPAGSDWQAVTAAVTAGSCFSSLAAGSQRAVPSNTMASHLMMPSESVDGSGGALKTPAIPGFGEPLRVTAPPSSPSTRTGSVCQSHIEPENVFFTPVSNPRSSATVDPSLWKGDTEEIESFTGASFSDSIRLDREGTDACRTQSFDKIQTGAGCETTCRLVGQPAMSGAVGPGRGSSWSSPTQRQEAQEGDSGAVSPTVTHLDLGADTILGCTGNFGQVFPFSSQQYNTSSARLIDIAAGASREFCERQSNLFRAGAHAWDVFARDRNCVAVGAAVAAGDTIRKDGEVRACEGAESSPCQTSRNSIISCPTSASEGCHGLSEAGCLFGAAGNASVTKQVAVAVSSGESVAGRTSVFVPSKTVWRELEERLAVAAKAAASIRTSSDPNMAPTASRTNETGQDPPMSSGATMLVALDKRNADVVAEGSIRGHGPCIIQRTDGSLLRTKGIAPQDPNKRVFRRLMFSKTKICPWFEQGKCLRGDLCNYAHSRGELRVLPVAKKLCLSYLKVGRCSNPHCSFAHSTEEVEDSKKVKQGTQWQWRHFDDAAALWGQGLAAKTTAPETRNSSRLVKASHITLNRPRAAGGRCIQTTAPTGSAYRANDSSITGSEGLSISSASNAIVGCPLQLVNSRSFEPDIYEILRSVESVPCERVQAVSSGSGDGHAENSFSGFLPRRDTEDFSSYCFSGHVKGSDRGSGRCLGATRAGGGRIPEHALKRKGSRAVSQDVLTSQFHTLTLNGSSPEGRLIGSHCGAYSDTAVLFPERHRALRWDRKCGGNAGGAEDSSGRTSMLVPISSVDTEDEYREQRSNVVEPSTKDESVSLKSDVVLALLCQQLKHLIGRIYGVEGLVADMADNAVPSLTMDATANSTFGEEKRSVETHRHGVNDNSIRENVMNEPQAGGIRRRSQR